MSRWDKPQAVHIILSPIAAQPCYCVWVMNRGISLFLRGQARLAINYACKGTGSVLCKQCPSLVPLSLSSGFTVICRIKAKQSLIFSLISKLIICLPVRQFKGYWGPGKSGVTTVNIPLSTIAQRRALGRYRELFSRGLVLKSFTKANEMPFKLAVKFGHHLYLLPVPRQTDAGEFHAATTLLHFFPLGVTTHM